MEAARVCALRGHHVDLHEKSDRLGGVFVAASVQDYKEDDRRLLAWYIRQMDKLSVNIVLRSEVDRSFVAENHYDHVFLATGATERRLDTEGLVGPHVTYAIDTLLGPEIPGQNILIVGGGLTGIEIACDLGKRGKTVTVVEACDTILNAFGISAANTNMLFEMLDAYRVTVLTSTTVTKYENGVAQLLTMVKNFPNSANRAKMMYTVGPSGIPVPSYVKADHVVVSVGYNSNRGLYEELQDKNVHLIGDADKPENVLKAIWDAYDAARKI